MPREESSLAWSCRWSLELQQPLGPPKAGPSPTSRHREEAAQQCSGTHLQGSNAGCHPTRHRCVGPDFF